MAWFWLKSQEINIKIPDMEEKNGIIFYNIQVNVGDISWRVKHRYKDFYELHMELVNNHGMTKDILPPKKLIGAKSAEFIEQRRQGLENYLQKLIKFLKLAMPRIFSEFLDFHLYDIFFLLQTLAEKFYMETELSSPTSYKFNTLEMYSISTCCITPICIEHIQEKKYDFTHVLEFCSQLNCLHVTGLNGYYLQSNIKPNELAYDFKCFKKLDTLFMKTVNLDSIKDLGSLRDNLQELSVTHSKMSQVSQIFQCDVLHKNALDNNQVWKNLAVVDLSYNCLSELDQTINLLPNLKVLILDNNQFSELPDCREHEHLISLSMSGNLIKKAHEIHHLLPSILNLNLSANKLSSLKGFAKLYTLRSLNLSGNDINDIEELVHLSTLPNITDLKLTGNDVSTAIDYRIKVLDNFGRRAAEVVLDNELPSQSEIDRLSVRRALRISNERIHYEYIGN